EHPHIPVSSRRHRSLSRSLYSAPHHRALHSFPTRRSSDLAATCALGERDDVIVVASVSCIYGLGAPEEFFRLGISLRPGDTLARDRKSTRLNSSHVSISHAVFCS